MILCLNFSMTIFTLWFVPFVITRNCFISSDVNVCRLFSAVYLKPQYYVDENSGALANTFWSFLHYIAAIVLFFIELSAVNWFVMLVGHLLCNKPPLLDLHLTFKILPTMWLIVLAYIMCMHCLVMFILQKPYTLSFEYVNPYYALIGFLDVDEYFG